jgi:hypothetical protein
MATAGVPGPRTVPFFACSSNSASALSRLAISTGVALSNPSPANRRRLRLSLSGEELPLTVLSPAARKRSACDLMS